MKIFFFILLILESINGFSQNASSFAFSSEMLDKPGLYIKQYDEIFAYNEISKFKEISTNSKLVLENGYAASFLKKPDLWTSIKEGKKVRSVTIVFTKYPRKKKDWITNYNELLANRLKELFKIDPSLNSKDIKWYLLLQTECKTDKQARTFFHGIVITYESSDDTYKNNIVRNNKKKLELINKADTIILQTENDETNQKSRFVSETEFNKTNSFLNRETTTFSKKKKLARVPGCPDFTKRTFKKIF